MKRLTLYITTSWLLSLVFLSCKQEHSEKSIFQEKEIASEKIYVLNTKNRSSLSNNARDLSLQWESFSQLLEEIKSFNGETLDGLISKAPTLVAISDSLSFKIPDTLNSNLIQARVLVAKTRVQVLNQELKKGKPDTTKIQTALLELQQAMNNLIVQINQKIIKASIDKQRTENEKKELEKQKKFIDSVFKAELKNTTKKTTKQ